MTFLKTISAATAVAAFGMAGAAMAGDKSAVEAFYGFLNNPSSAEHAAAFQAASTEGWESIGDYSGKTKSRDAFVKQVGGFGQLIPDLDWAIQDILQDGNQFVVRSRATGTPVGPMFGVDGQGRSFDILTIDIHTVEDGKVVQTYHVEDWAGALRQLSGK